MIDKLTTEQLEAAAKWWIEAARNPTFDNLGKTRGRDPEETRTNTFASVMATMVSDKESPTEDQLTSFGEHIKKLLISHEEVCGYPPHTLHSDYGPAGVLYDACVQSGVKGSRMPWKTVMWFEHGGVQVACGYAAPPVEILKKETA